MSRVKRSFAIFPNTLEKALYRFAGEMGIPAEACHLVLLCVAASLIPSQTRLIYDLRTGSSEPPILWGGLVGDAGGEGSCIISTLTSPLKDLQAEHYAHYWRQLKDYEAAIQAHERGQTSEVIGDPSDRFASVELYTSGYTADEVEQILVRQLDRGLLVNLDDLANFLQGAGACQDERKAEQNRWLGLYMGLALGSGRGIADQIPIPHPSVSIVGRIPHSALQTIWSKRTRHGEKLLACFAWVKVPPTSGTQDGPVYNPRLLLHAVYHRLQASPPMQHVLDKKGQKLWGSWKKEIIELFCGERNRGIRSMLLNTGSRAVRIALVLHRLDAACSGVHPSEVIPADTFVRGMEFARRLQWQSEAVLPDIREFIY
jgi:hypothetical protein